MCALCSDGGREKLCPACVVRTGVRSFPLNRANWSFDKLWTYCFSRFQREWLMLTLAAFVFAAILGGSQIVGQLVQVLGQAADSIPLIIGSVFVTVALQWGLQGLVNVGMMHMLFHVLNGGKADVALLFAQTHKIGRYLVAMLIILAVALVPLTLLGVGIFTLVQVGGLEGPMVALLALVVGIPMFVAAFYFGLPLYLLPAEVAYSEETSAIQLLKNCYALAHGERFSILGVGFVSGLVILVGVLACCVGALPAMGLAQLLIAGLYLSLRTGADIPEPSRE